MVFRYILPAEPAYWSCTFLVPLFNGGNIQAKSLPVLVAYCLEIFWEAALVKVSGMHF